MIPLMTSRKSRMKICRFKVVQYEWISQAKRDAEAGGEGKLPAVFHKKNHAPILVTMELEDFMCLYREWEAGFDLAKRDEEKNYRD